MSNPERWVRFNPLPANIRTKIEQLTTWFQQSDVQLAYLFGSLATSGKGQDVDLALLTETVPVYRYRIDLYELLETQRLDLIDLAKAPPPSGLALPTSQGSEGWKELNSLTDQGMKSPGYESAPDGCWAAAGSRGAGFCSPNPIDGVTLTSPEIHLWGAPTDPASHTPKRSG